MGYFEILYINPWHIPAVQYDVFRMKYRLTGRAHKKRHSSLVVLWLEVLCDAHRRNTLCISNAVVRFSCKILSSGGSGQYGYQLVALLFFFPCFYASDFSSRLRTC